jgi:hypothetical protein
MKRSLASVATIAMLAWTGHAVAQAQPAPAAGAQPKDCAFEIKKIDAEVMKVAKTDKVRADEARKLRAEAVKFEREGKTAECLDKAERAKQVLNVQ